MSLMKRNSFGSLFNDLLKYDPWEDWNFPTFDVSPKWKTIQKDDNIILRAELPGYEEKDISIEIKDRYLTIKGTHSNEENSDVFSSSYSSFEKTIMLSDDIILDKISAEMKSGILAITIPKEKKTEIKSKVIPINKQLKS